MTSVTRCGTIPADADTASVRETIPGQSFFTSRIRSSAAFLLFNPGE